MGHQLCAVKQEARELNRNILRNYSVGWDTEFGVSPVGFFFVCFYFTSWFPCHQTTFHDLQYDKK